MRNTRIGRWICGALLAAVTATAGRVAVAAEGETPTPDPDGWVRLFNGKDLAGWDGDPAVWHVEDGCIVGRADRITKNTFLVYTHPFGDFTLRARVKLTEKGSFPNSGIQYRSKLVDAAAHVVAGYQLDIGPGHWGDVHEEQGRPTLAKGSEQAAASVKRGDWNEYEITALGNSLTHRVNGVVAAHFDDADAKRAAASGVVALQYHQPGEGFEIRFQDVRIKLPATGGVGAGAARPAAKAAVPTADEQAAARKQVRTVFAQEYATQTPAARAALAAKLLKLADEPADNAASRFVLLAEARDLAAAGGDVKAALGFVDRMAAVFAIDAPAAKADLLAAVGRAPESPAAAVRAAKLALPLADEALKDERYDTAERLFGIAEAAATKGADGVIEVKARQLLKLTRERRAFHDRALAAERVLAQTPTDPTACGTVGAYRCFVRGDWAGGLPLLAKGTDATLAALARDEVGEPKDAASRLRLGDRWWEAGEKVDETDRTAYRRRAGFWYEQVVAGLGGLSKVVVEKRLAELTPSKAATTGPVDLLKLVDIDTDAVSGTWRRVGTQLACGAAQAQRLVLPAAAEGGYELTVRFVRQSGDDAVLIYLPAGKGGTMLVLSGWGTRTTALYNVNGRRAAEVPARGLVNGREYRVDARVELQGEDAEVTVRLNDSPYLHWKGRQSALALDERWGLPTAKCFAVGAVEKTSFSAATVRALSGGIVLLRP